LIEPVRCVKCCYGLQTSICVASGVTKVQPWGGFKKSNYECEIMDGVKMESLLLNK